MKLYPYQEALITALAAHSNAIVPARLHMGSTVAAMVAACRYESVLWVTKSPSVADIGAVQWGDVKDYVTLWSGEPVSTKVLFVNHTQVRSANRFKTLTATRWDLIVAEDNGSLHNAQTQISQRLFHDARLQSDRMWVINWTGDKPCDFYGPCYRMLGREKLSEMGLAYSGQWVNAFMNFVYLSPKHVRVSVKPGAIETVREMVRPLWVDVPVQLPED